MDMTHHRLKDHLDEQEGSIREVRDKRDRIRLEVETLEKTKDDMKKKLEKIESHLEMRMEELTGLDKEVEAFEAEHPHAAALPTEEAHARQSSHKKIFFPETHPRIPPDPRKDVTSEVGQ